MGPECPQKVRRAISRSSPEQPSKVLIFRVTARIAGTMIRRRPSGPGEQIECAKSVAIRRGRRSDHERPEADGVQTDATGALGIGISFKVKSGAPLPLRYYREKQLERQVTCSICTLTFDT